MRNTSTKFIAGFALLALTSLTGCNNCGTSSAVCNPGSGVGVGGGGVTTPAHGSLDTTFNTTGKVTTAIGTGNDGAGRIAIQSDGKIVAVGYSMNGTAAEFALARYNTDGSVDTTFNITGKVTTAIGTIADIGSGVAIQSDGKIVAVGYSMNGTDFDFALVRYNTDGSLDTTFNTTGIVTTAIGASMDYGNAVAIQSDGKIVVAGESYTGANADFALVRYNTDGSLDTTFNTTGMVTTAIGGGADNANAVAIQADGKIVAAGYSNNGTDLDFALVRYNTDGSLDTTFNTMGAVSTAIGPGDDYARAVAIQADGKIVAAGPSNNGADLDFAVVRYNTDGSLDTSFNTTGKVTTAIGTGEDNDGGVAIQADNKILVAGASYNGTDNDFALVRYNTDGSLDTNFNTTGKATTAIGASNDNANAVAIQADGKIVVAGSSSNGTDNDFALVRYWP
jgi:uncharacterized delta-60 repeat protein